MPLSAVMLLVPGVAALQALYSTQCLGADLPARGLHVDSAAADIAMTAIASVPITQDDWEPLPGHLGWCN